MKKLAKITVSLLLVIAILSSIAWYLLVYDPDFSRDFLLQQAHNFEEKGRNAIAVWLYELAYRQAGQDDSVAIELAEYYKSIGNYSKAEYTLSQAIEDGGSLELYIALCKTFVEQDKLRDAAMMLDRVSTPEIKSQLDALRPAAPESNFSSGHYSQYITVEFTCENATVYVSTDQDYPSVGSDAYTGPVTLSRGETTFFAIAVSEDGLVSSLAEYQYYIAGVVEVVEFTDPSFETAVRQQLEISDNVPIYSDTLWSLTSFTIPSSAISCTDLIWLPNLTELSINNCAFSDMQILSELDSLQTLYITNSVISSDDLTVISQLPLLENLTMSGCYLSTIRNLAGATGLKYLDLSQNSIRDISALTGMTQLEYLDLSDNALIRLDDLSGLTSLKTLDVSYNSLITTAPVASLTGLTKLNISGNNLMQSEVTGIDSLTNLTWFAANDNQLLNVSFLQNCTGLQTLLISNNTIIDLSVLSAHTHLEQLDFSYNEVETFPTFSAGCPLHTINGNYNQIKSIDQLTVLQSLKLLYLDYNPNLKQINKLISCSSLELVSVYGTSVRSAATLLDAGIFVNYTPV